MVILPFLEIAQSPIHGRGVFATEDIEEGTLIEFSPLIILPSSERGILQSSKLYDYYFEWSESQIAVGLGYLSIYNHASPANCYWERLEDKQAMRVISQSFILKGQELTIDYMTGDKALEKLWFDTKKK